MAYVEMKNLRSGTDSLSVMITDSPLTADEDTNMKYYNIHSKQSDEDEDDAASSSTTPNVSRTFSHSRPPTPFPVRTNSLPNIHPPPNSFPTRVTTTARDTSSVHRRPLFPASPQFVRTSTVFSALNAESPEVIAAQNNKRSWIERRGRGGNGAGISYDGRTRVVEGGSGDSLNLVRRLYDLQKEARRGGGKGGRWSTLKVWLEYDIYKFFTDRKSSSVDRIILFILAELIVDIAFCLMYAVELNHSHPLSYRKDDTGFDYSTVEPMALFIERSKDMWYTATVLSGFNLASSIIRFLFLDDKKRFFYTVTPYIDLVTAVPFMVSTVLPYGRFLYVPYFLRCWVVIIRVRRALAMKRGLGTKEPFDPLNEKLITLVMTIAALLFSAMCAFQFFEMAFIPRVGETYTNLGLADSFYFILITVSTVGYGDITPRTVPGKMVVVMMILVAISVLPGLISTTMDTLNERKAGGGSFFRTKTKYVIVNGCSLRLSQIQNVLDGLYCNDRDAETLHVVFLSRHKPSREIKALLSAPLYKYKTTYLVGGALNEHDLKRSVTRHASAIFILCNRFTRIPKGEDEKITFRVWAFALHAPNVPIYAYTLLPDTEHYLYHAREVVCFEELKHILMAYNTLYRGVGTLVCNLLLSFQPSEMYAIPWMAQFRDGGGNELYSGKINPLFVGRKFGWLSWFIYSQYQIILVAVQVYIRPIDTLRLVLNPGNDYTMTEDDVLVYISQGPKKVANIANLTTDQFSRVCGDDEYSQTRTSSGSSLHLTSDLDLRISQAFNTRQYAMPLDDTTTVGPPAHPSIDTQSPLCHLLKVPVARIQSMTIENADYLDGHIIVCAGKNNLNSFVSTLRAVHLRPEQFRDVVILRNRKPTTAEFHHVNMFPRVYFMIADARRQQDLFAAGVYRAKRIVILSQPDPDYHDQDFSDNVAIMQSYLIRKMLRGRNQSDENVSVELLETPSIKFMHAAYSDWVGQGNRMATGIDYFHSSLYASGKVLVSSFLEQVLFRTYRYPLTLETMRLLCGVRHKSASETDDFLNLRPVYLMTMDPPEEFVDKPFLDLFKNLTVYRGIVPLGLLRAPDPDLGNTMSFVYTNPLPAALVKSTDVLYVLKTVEA